MDMTAYILFISATLVLLAIPGPAVLYIVTRSVSQGTQAGIVSTLGIQLGTVFHVIAAALGVSALLVASATAYATLKYLGAAYLIFLGLRTLFGKTPADGAAPVDPMSLKKIFAQGMIVNILNPKTALFFFAFLPQFVNPARGSVTLQMLTLGAIFIALGTISDGIYALVAGKLGSWLKRRPGFWKFQRNFSGAVYIGLGALAALSGRDE